MCTITQIAVTLVFLGAILHTVICIFTDSSLCALSKYKILSKLVDVCILLGALWVFTFVVPGLIGAKTFKSVKCISELCALVLVLLSALTYCISCLIDYPVCSIVKNRVGSNILNVTVLACTLYLILCTKLMHN